MSNLKKIYQEKVVPRLKKELGCKNTMACPRLEKVVVNVGVGKGLKDTKYNEGVEDTLRRITGQQPVKTKAKKAISAFKIRKGMVVGMKVTLRGTRMYDFVDKLINVALPRVRDFRGLSEKAMDQEGNLNIGLKEHTAFPEIKSDELEGIHGLEVAVHTSAKTREAGTALLKYLGFPFKSAS